MRPLGIWDLILEETLIDMGFKDGEMPIYRMNAPGDTPNRMVSIPGGQPHKAVVLGLHMALHKILWSKYFTPLHAILGIP